MSSFSYSRLADYFRAVAALDAGHDTEKQRAIAEILGLEESIAPVRESTSVEFEPPPEPKRDDATPAQSRRDAVTAAPSESRRDQRRRKPVTFELRSMSPRSFERPAWLSESEILEPPRETSATPAPPQPLLPRQSSRAILSTSMATLTETNQIDVQALLDAETEGRTLLRIPQRVVPSLAHGIQVIVDRGPSAAPFDADQKLLIDQIRSIGGREMVSVVEIDPSSDFLAVCGKDDWGEYFPRYRPLPRVAVVIVSDLGIARVPFERTASAADWSQFIGRIRSGGNHVVAFVPYAPSRWPPSVRRLAALVHWDRRTTIQSVRRALRRSLR